MNSPIDTINLKKAWIFHREEFDTIEDGTCDLYVLLDASNEYCFGQELSLNLPPASKITDLLKSAFNKKGTWPEHVIISKKDPYLNTFKSICNKLNLKLEELPPKYFSPLVKEFHDSLQQFKRGDNNPNPPPPPLSDTDQKELEAFIPETYGPCTCGSGKKFKFCCKKGFKEITFAMCAAQDGHLEDALRFMKEAEVKIGLTAEILCRYAICWSFFDEEKSTKYLADALELNPKHPRANYISGIEAVASENYTQAISFYQKAIENYPQEDKFHLNETYNNLGTVYYKIQDYNNAKYAWEKALTLLPTDKMVLNNLFQCIYENPEVPEEIREITPFMKKFIEKEC